MKSQDDPVPRTHVIGPYHFALAMVVIGLLALVAAIVEYRKRVRDLVAGTSGVAKRSLAVAVSLAFIVLGTLALGEILSS